MATIKDIAHLAGVSQGTVSNVLNGKGIVSSKKIKLVEEAAAQLGYTINERAKILRKGPIIRCYADKTGIIGNGIIKQFKVFLRGPTKYMVDGLFNKD